MHDDFTLVTGLKRTDQVLLFGNLIFPGLKNLNDSVEAARKGSDLTRLVRENSSFDRIYVSKDADVSEAGMKKIISMNRGLACFFVDNEQACKNLEAYFLKNHPWSDTWFFNTNVGLIFVTSASGAQDWLN